MIDPLIEVEDVKKSYGEVEAVRGISLSVERGELFGLIGPNGAGKTTLFKMLLGLVRPTSGKITVEGVDVSEVWCREVRARTGYLPEDIAFYNQLSGLETLRFYAKIKGATEGEVRELIERVGLSGAAGRKVGQYSKGMRQRLGLAQALMGNPDVLFLDEPTTGLDPEGIGFFYKILKEVKKRGVTIILTSHILKEIQDKVDRLGIIGGGKLLACGTVRDLRSALGLKPLVIVTFSGSAEDLKDCVRKAGGELCALNGDRLTLSVSAGNKMDVLKAVMGSKVEILDIEIMEPSLEDVFMGYAGVGEV